MAGLRLHQKTAHGSDRLTTTCLVCQKTFYNSTSFLKHKLARQHFSVQDIVTPRTKTIQCEHCNYQTNFRILYLRHFKANHSVARLATTPPKKTSTSTDFLFLQQVYKCPFKDCGMTTFFKDIMRYHFFQVHTTQDSFASYLKENSNTLCKKCRTDIPHSAFKKHTATCL